MSSLLAVSQSRGIKLGLLLALLTGSIVLSSISGLGTQPTAYAQEEAAEGDGGAAKGEDTGSSPKDESFLGWLIRVSGPFGMCLFLESFLLVALIVMVIMQFRRDSFIPTAFVEAFEQKLQQRDFQGAYELTKKDDSFTAKLLSGGLTKLREGMEAAQAGMAQVADDENMALDHKLTFISLIGTTGPMLGLLGTVSGMVGAFSVIANSQTSPKPAELATGIMEALVTTLEGLIVAIPAVITYALVKNRQARLVYDSALLSEDLLNRFAAAGKRPAGAGAPAAAPAAPAKPAE